MKNLSKKLALLLALAIAVTAALSGCGENVENQGGEDAPSDPAAVTDPVDGGAPAEDGTDGAADSGAAAPESTTTGADSSAAQENTAAAAPVAAENVMKAGGAEGVSPAMPSAVFTARWICGSVSGV